MRITDITGRVVKDGKPVFYCAMSLDPEYDVKEDKSGDIVKDYAWEITCPSYMADRMFDSYSRFDPHYDCYNFIHDV